MPYFFAALLGLAAGILVDFLSDILPARKNISHPICTNCGTNRSWWDYFRFTKCRSCGKPRHWRSAVTISAEVVFSLLLWVFPPLKWGYWLGILMVIYFGLVIVIDIEHHLILHTVTISGAIGALIIGSLIQGFLRTLLGGIIGFLFMFVFYALGVLFARRRAKKSGLDPSDAEALGFGDVTISGVLGLLLGFLNVFPGLITGILLAGVFSIFLIAALMIAKKFEAGNIYIPYGPFLVLGACVYLFFK